MLDFELTEEQSALQDTVRRFTRERIIPVAAQCDHDSKFPVDVDKEAHNLGFVGSVIPAEYGGMGLDEIDSVIMVEELAYGCTGIQTSITATTLAATPVIFSKNEEAKKKYLGMLTSICCLLVQENSS
jgi:acyl-CoA dehydrogenase